eukprot:863996_1
MARLKEELREKSESVLEETKRHQDELDAVRSKNNAQNAALESEKKALSDKEAELQSMAAKFDALSEQHNEIQKEYAAQRDKDRVRTEKESEKSLMAQKQFYEDQLRQTDESHKAEVMALNKAIDTLTADIGQKRDEFTKKQEDIATLQSCVSDQKARNDALNDQVNVLSHERDGLKAEKENLKHQMDDLQRHFENEKKQMLEQKQKSLVDQKQVYDDQLRETDESHKAGIAALNKTIDTLTA